MIKKPNKVKLPKEICKFKFYKEDCTTCALGFLLLKAGLTKKQLQEINDTDCTTIDKKEKTFSKILNEVYGLPRVKCHEIMFGNDELKENKDRIEYLKTILDELNIKYYGDKNVKET